jgi:hypothetical protein
MTTETTNPTSPLFLIEFARGVFAGDPPALRVKQRTKASLWADERLALAQARELGGQVVAWTPPAGVAAAMHLLARRPKAAAPMAPRPALRLVPTVAPAEVRRPRGGKAGGKATEPPAPAAAAPSARPPKAPKGPAREEVVALLAATGLPLQAKSSDHYGDPRGPRLVLPRSAAVTRVFLYRMPEATSLPGYKTPEERKQLGLGAVTHVADVTELDQLRPLVEAVCAANGLKAPKAPAKRTRTKRATGPQAPLGEAGGVPVEGTTTEQAEPTPTNEEA